MDHEKYSVKYGYDYIDHRVIYCPVIVAESVKFSLYEKIKYFIEDYGLIVVAAIADDYDIKQCMADITEDIFTVYEFGLALSCGVDVNKNSKKGFVRNVDGQNVWDDNILNLSLGVN